MNNRAKCGETHCFHSPTMIYHGSVCYGLLMGTLRITCKFQLIFELKKMVMTQKLRIHDKFTFAALDKTLAATEMFPRSGQTAALDIVNITEPAFDNTPARAIAVLLASCSTWIRPESSSISTRLHEDCHAWQGEPTF